MLNWLITGLETAIVGSVVASFGKVTLPVGAATGPKLKIGAAEELA